MLITLNTELREKRQTDCNDCVTRIVIMNIIFQYFKNILWNSNIEWKS